MDDRMKVRWPPGEPLPEGYRFAEPLQPVEVRVVLGPEAQYAHDRISEERHHQHRMSRRQRRRVGKTN